MREEKIWTGKRLYGASPTGFPDVLFRRLLKVYGVCGVYGARAYDVLAEAGGDPSLRESLAPSPAVETGLMGCEVLLYALRREMVSYSPNVALDVDEDSGSARPMTVFDWQGNRRRRRRRMQTASSVPGPRGDGDFVGCEELGAMGLVDTSGRCELCHSAERHVRGRFSGPRRVAFVCCAARKGILGGKKSRRRWREGRR